MNNFSWVSVIGKHRRFYKPCALDEGRARVQFPHPAFFLKTFNALVAQWSEQRSHKALVTGSNPVGGTTLILSSSAVERSPVKRLVVGSNPTSGAIYLSRSFNG